MKKQYYIWRNVHSGLLFGPNGVGVEKPWQALWFSDEKGAGHVFDQIAEAQDWNDERCAEWKIKSMYFGGD